MPRVGANLRNAFLSGLAAIAALALLATGCVSKTAAQMRAQKAYIAGQQQAWQQYQQTRPNTVRVVGPVQLPLVDWVEGQTLVQVIVAAQYTLPGEPRLILLTHGQEQTRFTAQQLLQGHDVPVYPGDAVELLP